MTRERYRKRAHASWTIGECGKRGYPSQSQARAANRKAGWRVRPYRCDVCHAWHVTNHEKSARCA